MPTEVLMPALSPTMEKGNLAKWLKKEGDPIKSGDVIAEIETDKATMEVEAVDEGTLGKILVPEGTNDVAVNTPIAMILGEGEDAATLKDGKQAPSKQSKAEQPSRQDKAAESAPPAQKPQAAMQAMDQLINSAAKTQYMSGGQVKVSIVFRGPNGPASRVAAQHSQDYSAWYSHIPGLKVIAPSNAADAKGLLKAAIRDPNPVIFLENEILYGHSSPVPKLDDYVLPIGRALIARAGKDVTLIAWSIGMTYALKAAEELAKDGIEAEVIDLRTLKPMDTDTIVESVKKTSRLVTVEEGWKQSGVGAEIAARVMEDAFAYLDARVTRVCGKDVPMPYAANLEKLALPSGAEVVEATKAVSYR